MVLIDEPKHSRLFLLKVCSVCCLIHFSPAEVIFHLFAVTRCSGVSLWLWMSSLGYISLVFSFFSLLTAELKAVSQLFAFPHSNASAEHILWYLIACYLNFKKHGTELSEVPHYIRGERQEAQWSNSSCCRSDIKKYQGFFIKIMHTDVLGEEDILMQNGCKYHEPLNSSHAVSRIHFIDNTINSL